MSSPFPVYMEQLIQMWEKVRPNERPRERIPLMMQSEAMIVTIQMAFEAGRKWQHEHPTASVEFPDYSATCAPSKEAGR